MELTKFPELIVFFMDRLENGYLKLSKIGCTSWIIRNRSVVRDFCIKGRGSLQFILPCTPYYCHGFYIFYDLNYNLSCFLPPTFKKLLVDIFSPYVWNNEAKIMLKSFKISRVCTKYQLELRKLTEDVVTSSIFFLFLFYKISSLFIFIF